MYPCLDFETCVCDEEKIHLAYNIFKQDFIHNACCIDKILITSKSSKKVKIYKMRVEEVFWHIVSRKDKNKQRVFDESRAKRIAWVKHILLDYKKPHIKMFYVYETNHIIRLYLWLYNHDFVVILERIITKEKIAFIVTSFCIDNVRKRQVFANKYEDYIYKKDSRLKDCEWF